MISLAKGAIGPDLYPNFKALLQVISPAALCAAQQWTGPLRDCATALARRAINGLGGGDIFVVVVVGHHHYYHSVCRHNAVKSMMMEVGGGFYLFLVAISPYMDGPARLSRGYHHHAVPPYLEVRELRLSVTLPGYFFLDESQSYSPPVLDVSHCIRARALHSNLTLS